MVTVFILSASNKVNLDLKLLKVACVVKIKLIFYEMVLLEFDNTN